MVSNMARRAVYSPSVSTAAVVRLGAHSHINNIATLKRNKNLNFREIHPTLAMNPK